MSNVTNLYTIGQISKLCNIPIKTLRFYDEEGILQPEKRDMENNYRYYSEKQLLQLIFIKELKVFGLSLDDIKKSLFQKNLLLFSQKLEEKAEEIETNIQKLQLQLQQTMENRTRVKNGLELLKVYHNIEHNIEEKDINVEVNEFPENTVIYTNYRSQCNANELFLERQAELQTIRDKYQLYSCGPLMAVFHDHYTSQFFADDTCFELCLPIIGDQDKTYPNVKKFGGFLCASTIFIGNYRDMLVVYLTLVEWIEKNGYQIVGPAVEQYLIDPIIAESELDYVTRIVFPIEKTC